MSRTISPAGLRELFAQHSGHVLLTLLTVSHATLPEPLRLVNDRRSLEHDGHTWTALPFELVLPADTEDEIPHVELRIDNVGRVLTELLRTVAEPVDVELSVVRVAPDGSVTPELGPLDFSLLDAQIRTDVITARLGYEIDVLNEPATREIFNPSLAPGLFK